MSWSRYRVVFGLMILYMSVACVVACSLLWNITFSQHPIEEIVQDNLVPTCSVTKNGNKEPPDPLHNCTIFQELEMERFVANGWTKTVHKAKLAGSVVAIKSVNTYGKDISDCVRTSPILVCHNLAVEKLLKEVRLLKVLKHENIIELKYYCAKSGEFDTTSECVKNALIATEMGEPLTNLRLLQLTWKERSRLILDLANLLHFAETSPLGAPLALADLRRPQFVLVKGRLKLSDLDDIVVGEPSCKLDLDCAGLNVTTNIACIENRCKGYSSKFNIQKSYREFGPYIFIPEGVPINKKSALDGLRLLWKENMVSVKELLSASKMLL